MAIVVVWRSLHEQDGRATKKAHWWGYFGANFSQRGELQGGESVSFCNRCSNLLYQNKTGELKIDRLESSTRLYVFGSLSFLPVGHTYFSALRSALQIYFSALLCSTNCFSSSVSLFPFQRKNLKRYLTACVGFTRTSSVLPAPEKSASSLFRFYGPKSGP